jgi:hypothetical protein
MFGTLSKRIAYYWPGCLAGFFEFRPFIEHTVVQFVGTKTRVLHGPEVGAERTRGEFQMPRFYFHKHLNGQTVPDRRGTSLRNKNEACARAVRCTPLALKKSVSSVRNTYLAWEVSDGEHTIYVVRGVVVIEKL